MADQTSVELLAFNFASRKSAYLRLAQGLSRALSAFSSFMRKYLDTVIKADHCAQNVDDISISANTTEQLIRNNRADFKCIHKAVLKLTVEKCHFGVTQVEFLGQKDHPGRSSYARSQSCQVLVKNLNPKVKKTSPKDYWVCRLLYPDCPKNWLECRNYWRRTPRSQFLKNESTTSKQSTLALRKPVAYHSGLQYLLMTDAIFRASGDALKIEEIENKKLLSKKKNFASVASGLRVFSPSQLKMSIYCKEFLAIHHAFREYSHILWETTVLTLVLTDNRSVTRFFQTKNTPSTFWNACDYVLQFKFYIMHVAGSQNTAADFLSRLELTPKEKVQFKLPDDILTATIELNQQSTYIADKKHNFFLPDEEESEQEIFARRTLSKQRALDKEHQQNQSAEVTEVVKIPPNTAVYAYLDGVLMKKYYGEDGNVTHHQILIPRHIVPELLSTLYRMMNKQPGITTMIQEVRTKC